MALFLALGISMTFATSLSLAIATFIFVMTPGPGVMAIVARTLTGGLLTGVILGVGLILGDLIYLTLTLASLHAFAESLIPFMQVVRVCGGLYLGWLGVMLFRAPPPKLDSEPLAGQKRNLLMTGILISSSNPKVVIFYLSFLPLFIDMASLDVPQSFQVVSIITAVLLTGVVITSGLAYQIKRLVRTPAGGKRLNQICGILMMGVGIGLIATI